MINAKNQISIKLISLLLGSYSLTFMLGLMIPLKASSNNTESKNFTKKSFVAEAVKKSGPAVVTLETQRKVITYGRQNSFPPGLFIDPYFQEFFGLPSMRSQRSQIERGQGSGFIFSPEGLVLTNAHVVEKSDQLMVGMSDGRRVPGKVLGLDSITDLAVVQLRGSGPWPTAPLGDSDKIVVGDWAIAVGNPFGLENTVTLGIVSNLNRNVAQLGISGKRLDLIQTDAAINPGNSGGPLLNSDGEVIGINTLVRSGPGAGLGFAIPINQARKISRQLIEKGRASHPVIGVSLSSINEGTNSLTEGTIIRHVIKGGPAEKGGLQVGDRIIAIAGKPMTNPGNVVNAINDHGTKGPLAFRIKRNNKILTLFITPKDMFNIK